MQNSIGNSPDLNKNKPKNKTSLTTKLIATALTISAAIGMAKISNDQINTAHKKSIDTASHVNEELPPGQIPLSPGIEMPKVYIPQTAKTKGLDAFDPVELDKSQDWTAVDRATANKPAKPSTAKRSD
jgi:hypothetical protein